MSINDDFDDNANDLIYICRRCNEFFYSNNKLHRHFKQCRRDEITNFNISKNNFIIEFKIDKNQHVDYNFRLWRYARIHVNLNLNKLIDELCLNNNTTIFIANRQYIFKKISKTTIHRINESIRIKNIDIIWHDTFEYVLMNFYISRVIVVDMSTKTHFIREIHLINDLTTKILIDVNIIVSKKIIINVDK